MTTTNRPTKATNYVVVVDFNPYYTLLEDQYLLGWDSKYDWFDCETSGDELITPKNRIKKNSGVCIYIDRWVGVYVSDTQDWCQECSDDGIKEGYDCTVCKLEKNSDGEWIVVPV